MGKVKCSECGHKEKWTEDLKYCPKCGKEVEKKMKGIKRKDENCEDCKHWGGSWGNCQRKSKEIDASNVCTMINSKWEPREVEETKVKKKEKGLKTCKTCGNNQEGECLELEEVGVYPYEGINCWKYKKEGKTKQKPPKCKDCRHNTGVKCDVPRWYNDEPTYPFYGDYCSGYHKIRAGCETCTHNGGKTCGKGINTYPHQAGCQWHNIKEAKKPMQLDKCKCKDCKYSTGTDCTNPGSLRCGTWGYPTMRCSGYEVKKPMKTKLKTEGTTCQTCKFSTGEQCATPFRTKYWNYPTSCKCCGYEVKEEQRSFIGKIMDEEFPEEITFQKGDRAVVRVSKNSVLAVRTELVDNNKEKGSIQRGKWELYGGMGYTGEATNRGHDFTYKGWYDKDNLLAKVRFEKKVTYNTDWIVDTLREKKTPTLPQNCITCKFSHTNNKTGDLCKESPCYWVPAEKPVERVCITCKHSPDNTGHGHWCNKVCCRPDLKKWELFVKPAPVEKVKECKTCKYSWENNPQVYDGCNSVIGSCRSHEKWELYEVKTVKKDSCNNCKHSITNNGLGTWCTGRDCDLYDKWELHEPGKKDVVKVCKTCKYSRENTGTGKWCSKYTCTNGQSWEGREVKTVEKKCVTCKHSIRNNETEKGCENDCFLEDYRSWEPVGEKKTRQTSKVIADLQEEIKRLKTDLSNWQNKTSRKSQDLAVKEVDIARLKKEYEKKALNSRILVRSLEGDVRELRKNRDNTNRNLHDKTDELRKIIKEKNTLITTMSRQYQDLNVNYTRVEKERDKWIEEHDRLRESTDRVREILYEEIHALENKYEAELKKRVTKTPKKDCDGCTYYFNGPGKKCCFVGNCHDCNQYTPKQEEPSLKALQKHHKQGMKQVKVFHNLARKCVNIEGFEEMGFPISSFYAKRDEKYEWIYQWEQTELFYHTNDRGLKVIKPKLIIEKLPELKQIYKEAKQRAKCNTVTELKEELTRW